MFFKRLAFRAQAGKDEAPVDCNARRRSQSWAFRETASKLTRAAETNQISFRVVDPAMIAADEAFRIAVCLVANGDRAMATGVEEHADASIFAAHYKHRLSDEQQRFEVARLWNFPFVRNVVPALA